MSFPVFWFDRCNMVYTYTRHWGGVGGIFLIADKETVWAASFYDHHLQTSRHTPDDIQQAHDLFNVVTFVWLLLPSLTFSCLPLFLSSRIRQAKVQILPERILPDPLSAVQLTPLSRLHIHPSSKPPTQSCKQAQCWWSNYQQVRCTHTYTQHTVLSSNRKPIFGV